jgi:hypothetical protein
VNQGRGEVLRLASLRSDLVSLVVLEEFANVFGCSVEAPTENCASEGTHSARGSPTFAGEPMKARESEKNGNRCPKCKRKTTIDRKNRGFVRHLSPGCKYGRTQRD